MPIPAAAILGASALSGLFSGLGASSAAKRSLREQQRQFNISGAPGIARLQQGAGLRDRLMQIMGARFGSTPTTYTQEQGMYQPSRSLQEQEDLYHRLMNQMGYRGLGQPAPQQAAGGLQALINRTQGR